MKTLTTLLALATLCATAYGQTIKTLGYNTTNGEVVANTGTNTLTFTNALAFTTNAVAEVRTNLGLGATWLTNTNAANFRNAIGAGTVNEGGEPDFQSITITDEGDSISLVANAKSTMRNLAGSTNTNEPFSGSFIFVNDEAIAFTAVVSNGIILRIDP
jgi:hypothetical protein